MKPTLKSPFIVGMYLGLVIVCTCILMALGIWIFSYHTEIVVYSSMIGGFAMYRVVTAFWINKEGCGDGHYHKDDKGLLVRCFHKCKNLMCEPSFWVGVTFSFPIEHYLWTKVWPFHLLSELMGV